MAGAEEEWDDWGDGDEGIGDAGDGDVRQPAASGPRAFNERLEADIGSIEDDLRALQRDIVDPAILEHINRNLSKVKFSKFIQYYSKNKNLSLYTIETELKVRIASPIQMCPCWG
jgi:hypothetical protein